jgi:hypothetical protein
MKGGCENAIQVMQNWFKSNQGTVFPTFFYQVDKVTTLMYTDKIKAFSIQTGSKIQETNLSNLLYSTRKKRNQNAVVPHLLRSTKV